MEASFEEKAKTYKEKFPNVLQNWKKIRALVNYSKAVKEREVWEELESIIRFYLKGYLWKSQEALLDEILAHYEIDYTKWAVKDGWVKMQMYQGQKCPMGSNQLEFPFFDLDKKILEGRLEMPYYSKIERYKLIMPGSAA